MLNRFVLFLALLFVITSFSLGSCSREDGVKAIQMLIKDGAIFAEEHDIGAIMKLTTHDFLALPGKLDRRGASGILWRTFKYYGKLKVLHPRPSIDLHSDGRAASARVPFLILKQEHSFPGLKELYEDPERWLEKASQSADLYRFKLQLVRMDGDWLVKQALLEKFTGLGFSE